MTASGPLEARKRRPPRPSVDRLLAAIRRTGLDAGSISVSSEGAVTIELRPAMAALPAAEQAPEEVETWFAKWKK